ncbi:hypothetical protein NEIRO03_2526 [Nematocida sp. AWRm78]|nr:hypothetical protein NEIRO03_2526 [Nematocida sp. AWRm78]
MRSNTTLPCHVVKIENKVNGESSLLDLGSGPSLRGHAVLDLVVLGLVLKLSR